MASLAAVGAAGACGDRLALGEELENGLRELEIEAAAGISGLGGTAKLAFRVPLEPLEELIRSSEGQAT